MDKNKTIEKNVALSTTEDLRPLVSIIIPVYNVERYLRQCLDSVVSQTVTNVEIICVDDGSPDSSYKILEEYQAKDSRIVVIRQENKGVAVARNVGATHASGKYLFFADPDDKLAPSLCQKMTEFAEKTNAQMLLNYSSDNLKSRFRRFSQFGRLYDSELFERGYCGNLSTDQRRLLLYMAGDCACWQYFYRRDFWIEQRLKFPEGIRIRADVCMSYYAFIKVERIALLRENLYYYRLREDSATRKDIGKRLGTRIDAFTAFRQTRDFYLENAPSLLQTIIEIELLTWYRFSRGMIREELQVLKNNVDSLADDSVLQVIYQKDRLPFKVRQFWLKYYGRSYWERIRASLWSRFFDNSFRLERFYKNQILSRMKKRKQEHFE